MTVKELREYLADKPDDMEVFYTDEGEEYPPEPQLASEAWPLLESTRIWDASGWNKMAEMCRNPERILL